MPWPRPRNQICSPGFLFCSEILYLCTIFGLLWQKTKRNILEDIRDQEYKYGFTSDIETELLGKGLSEEVVREISARKASRSG